MCGGHLGPRAGNCVVRGNFSSPQAPAEVCVEDDVGLVGFADRQPELDVAGRSRSCFAYCAAAKCALGG